MKVKLLAFVVGLLMLLESPALVAQTLTSNPSGTVFCNGSEVIFTCETRGSGSLKWTGDNFYIQDEISFRTDLDRINTMRPSLSNENTIATLTQIDQVGRVLVSTLRIIANSSESSGFVVCDDANGTVHRLDFHIFAPPVIPEDVVTFQLEHIQNMCAIATVLQSPTNPVEADATTYTVSMDGESVTYRNASFTSISGMKHSALVHSSSCGAHGISISINNMCGQSQSTDEKMLDPEQRIVLSVESPTSAYNNTIELNAGSSQVNQSVLIGVTIPMAVSIVGAFALGFLCGIFCRKKQQSIKLSHDHNQDPEITSGADLDKKLST